MTHIRPRLKDIAAATGFSTNTVSLALRSSPLVTGPTRSIILKAAEELRYRPNVIAKSLVQRQTRSVGLILTNIANPILVQTAQIAETALAEHGYITLFATSRQNMAHEMRAIEAFCQRQVDGILIYPSNHTKLDHIAALRQLQIPVVLLAAETGAGIDVVSWRERLGAFLVIDHLIELGHRRIGMVDSGKPEGNTEKLDGYEQALSKWNIPIDPELERLKRGYSPALGSNAMAELMALPDPPTAVFGSNDAFAVGMLDWCHRNGLRVPRDMSIVGFDNTEFSAYTTPPLTTVAYDPAALAEKAVERLLFLIEATDKDIPPMSQLIEPGLIMRQSTAVPKSRLPLRSPDLASSR
jgi:DNA-binding LacI/PurR family transcriptional regulator